MSLSAAEEQGQVPQVVCPFVVLSTPQNLWLTCLVIGFSPVHQELLRGSLGVTWRSRLAKQPLFSTPAIALLVGKEGAPVNQRLSSARVAVGPHAKELRTQR